MRPWRICAVEVYDCPKCGKKETVKAVAIHYPAKDGEMDAKMEVKTTAECGCFSARETTSEIDAGYGKFDTDLIGEVMCRVEYEEMIKEAKE